MAEKSVSVIIPFFNRIPWCLEAIESVRKQTYSNWELILVDDGSTEDTGPVRAAVQADPRLRLLRQENRGVSAARNAGIAVANGFYIALLDSDDLWAPQKLEKQISYMEEHGYRVSHTSYTVFDSNGTIQEIDTGSLQGDVLRSLIKKCPLCTPSAVAEKALVDHIHPPFQEAFHYGEDACFWISLASQAEFGAVREPLTFVRQCETRAANDIRKVRTALSNILTYIQGDPRLSSYRKETGQISRYIKRLDVKISLQQKAAGIKKRLSASKGA